MTMTDENRNNQLMRKKEQKPQEKRFAAGLKVLTLKERAELSNNCTVKTHIP